MRTSAFPDAIDSADLIDSKPFKEESSAMLFEQTTLCYIERDGQYLMLHRVKKDGDVNRDKWVGVGGHFEAGESPEECMAREVLEETGLTVTEYAYRGIVTFVSDEYSDEQMHLFTVTGVTGALCECDEGVLEWIDKKHLRSLPMWEGDKIFLDLIDTPCPFFSLKLVYRGSELVSAVLDGKRLR